jgi:hypothetical protein
MNFVEIKHLNQSFYFYACRFHFFIEHSCNPKFVRIQQKTDTPSNFFAHVNRNKYRAYRGCGRVQGV